MKVNISLPIIILIAALFGCNTPGERNSSDSKSDNSKTVKKDDTIFDEYDGLDSLAHIAGDPFYMGPSGEALNIGADNNLMKQFRSISGSSDTPCMRFLLNIDTNGNVTDYKLADFTAAPKIFYDDTIKTPVYDKLGNDFLKLALIEIKKYPKWIPAY